MSCLDRYLSSLPEDVTTLYLYSDGCPGQNKNLNVVHYLFALVRLGKFHHIKHHFPVRGHLFLPNDRDFGRTELKKKKTEHVYTPNQWYDTMRSARNRNPFKIVPVTQDMVKDIGVHLSLFFKKTVRAGKQPFNIQKVQILDYSSSHPTQVWVKYGAEDKDWTIFELEKKGVTFMLPTQLKYTYPIPIKPAK